MVFGLLFMLQWGSRSLLIETWVDVDEEALTAELFLDVISAGHTRWQQWAVLIKQSQSGLAE